MATFSTSLWGTLSAKHSLTLVGTGDQPLFQQEYGKTSGIVIGRGILRIADVYWTVSRKREKKKGPAEIWTRILRFRVSGANRYTTGPASCWVSYTRTLYAFTCSIVTFTDAYVSYVVPKTGYNDSTKSYYLTVTVCLIIPKPTTIAVSVVTSLTGTTIPPIQEVCSQLIHHIILCRCAFEGRSSGTLLPTKMTIQKLLLCLKWWWFSFHFVRNLSCQVKLSERERSIILSHLPEQLRNRCIHSCCTRYKKKAIWQCSILHIQRLSSTEEFYFASCIKIFIFLTRTSLW